MTATRDIGDYTTSANGAGQAYTSSIRESIVSLWALNGGLLTSVAGTNTITASLEVSDGFSAYGNGQSYLLIPANTNTGAVTLNIGDLGAKAVVDPDGDALDAGALVAGTLQPVVFVQASDHFRLITSTGVSNVTVTGGIHIHRSLPTRLAADTSEVTAQTQLLSRSYQATYTNSRVVIEGAISRKHATGTSDVDGLTIALFVDGSSEQTITDAVYDDAAQTSQFAFEYEPGDASAHTYSIRATTTLGATYHAGGTYMVLSEFSPNA